MSHGYGSMHRFILRTVASQGVVIITDAQQVLNEFSDNDQIPVRDIILAINDEIRPYQQEIKITKDEVSDEEVAIFLSLGYDDATKSQNVFSDNELEYFRVLIEQIMTTDSRQVTGINAMNLVSKMKSTFTKKDAEKLLSTWCRMRYLEKEENNYALGVRAIHEFEGYLRQNMPDTIENCCLCKHVVFRGYNCPACSLAIHTRCLKRYLGKVQKWPCCKHDFTEDQLECLNNEGSRLTQTQRLDNTRQTEENDTITEPSQTQNSIEDIEMTQNDTQEVPTQRVTRKRKRPS